MSHHSALLRAACFFAALGHAPPRVELLTASDWGGEISDLDIATVSRGVDVLIDQGRLRESLGRVGLAEGFEEALSRALMAEQYFPRKLRRAQQVANRLFRLPGVRFVALVNSTAWGMARDTGDLDFFVIVRHGFLWQTRLLSVIPYRVLQRMPGQFRGEQDGICLSYFCSDAKLNLGIHQLSSDDPYFRQWFLALIPLADDGIGSELWAANADIRARHPFAPRWQLPEKGIRTKPIFQVPAHRAFERPAERLQRRLFPRMIREIQNQDSRVLVSDQVLKFHVDDGRGAYREAYRRLCRTHGITA